MKSFPALLLSCLKVRVANGYTAIASGYQSAFCYFSEKHFGCSALKKKITAKKPKPYRVHLSQETRSQNLLDWK